MWISKKPKGHGIESSSDGIDTHMNETNTGELNHVNWMTEEKKSCPGYCPTSMWMLIKSVENFIHYSVFVCASLCVTWNINNNKKNKEEIGKNIIFAHANILRIFFRCSLCVCVSKWKYMHFISQPAVSIHKHSMLLDIHIQLLLLLLW